MLKIWHICLSGSSRLKELNPYLVPTDRLAIAEFSVALNHFGRPKNKHTKNNLVGKYRICADNSTQ